MRKSLLRNALLLSLLAVGVAVAVRPGRAADAEAPKLDKARLEAYLRYAEGFSPAVKFVIDDPTPSPFKGYYRVTVHLSTAQNKLDRVYYVTPDGRDLINGTIWNLNDNPFLDTFEHLPTTGPSFGPAAAKITLVIFSDFECPYCRAFARTVRDNVPQKYPNDVRVIFKDFPIQSIHPWAFAAAEAAHCLAVQKPDAFWAFHDWIFQHQEEINPGNLRDKVGAFAKEQNVDSDKVLSCLDTHAMGLEVNDSIQAGQALQIQQTPTTFANGRQLSGAIEWKTLDEVIQMELNRPSAVPPPPADKCCQVAIPTVLKK
jgi:protein-disulfide isomerase